LARPHEVAEKSSNIFPLAAPKFLFLVEGTIQSDSKTIPWRGSVAKSYRGGSP